MTTILRLLLFGLLASLGDLLAVAALVAIGVGCWWKDPSLGLIVPGAIVFGSLAVSRLLVLFLGGRD
jgi:hypothetical protein